MRMRTYVLDRRGLAPVLSCPASARCSRSEACRSGSCGRRKRVANPHGTREERTPRPHSGPSTPTY
jgi:hypothetical protein